MVANFSLFKTSSPFCLFSHDHHSFGKVMYGEGNWVREESHLLSLFYEQTVGKWSWPFFFVNKILLNYFLQRAHCAICTDRIWGLGRQGYKCINCKLLVHKKCHKLVTVECGRHSLPPVRHCCLIFFYRAFLITLLEQKAKIGGC